jgi:hypothetical protein
MGGFLSSHVTRKPPAINPEMVRFLRKEQIGRLLGLIHQPVQHSALKVGSKESEGRI